MNKRIVFLSVGCLLLIVAILSVYLQRPNQPIKFHPEHYHEYKKNHFLHYREIGQGSRTLILLHGFGSSHRTWDDVLPYLKQSGTRLIVVDLIGYGFSSMPEDMDFSMEANTHALIHLIKSKRIKNYVLIGHSFGGGVVLNTALKFNQAGTSVIKPDGLVLIDTAAYVSALPFFVEHLRVPLLGRMLLTVTPPAIRARYTLENIYFDQTKVTREKVQRYAAFLARPGSNTSLLESARQIIPKNHAALRAQYKSIQLPTLVIWGAQDKMLSIENGKRLVKEMPNARLVAIEKCGHNAQEEQPAIVAGEIKQFLNKQWMQRENISAD